MAARGSQQFASSLSTLRLRVVPRTMMWRFLSPTWWHCIMRCGFVGAERYRQELFRCESLPTTELLGCRIGFPAPDCWWAPAWGLSWVKVWPALAAVLPAVVPFLGFPAAFFTSFLAFPFPAAFVPVTLPFPFLHLSRAPNLTSLPSIVTPTFRAFQILALVGLVGSGLLAS